MTTTAQTSPSNSRSRKVGCGCAFFAGLFLFFFIFLPVGLGAAQAESLWVLLTGWTSFLNRTGSRIHWNFDLIAMCVLCTALALVLAHWLLRGFIGKVIAARGGNWIWPWKWTWCGAMVIGIAFIVGMAMGGIVHQVGWIHSNPEPLMERKGIKWEINADMRTMETAFRIASDDTATNLAEIRREMWNPTNSYFGSAKRTATAMQSCHFLLIVGENNAVHGTIIFPRDPTLAAKLGGSFALDGNSEWLRGEQLQARLKEYSARLISY